jgi:hypothetical protein
MQKDLNIYLNNLTGIFFPTAQKENYGYRRIDFERVIKGE